MSDDKQLFLVRVWRETSQFRASIRAPGDGEPQLFTRPEQVGEFLVAAVERAMNQPESKEDQ